MYKAKTILKNSGIVLAAMLAVPVILYGMVFTLSIANAAHNPNHNPPVQDKKVLVCKYVGTKGVDERPQLTGNEKVHNPIEVNAHALNPQDPDSVKVGDEFSDNQGRSLVVGVDGPCPAPVVPDDPKDDDPQECPAGQFWRGGCVSVGTCPYADGMNIEDPKCVAPNEVENTTSTPVINEETEVFYGK